MECHITPEHSPRTTFVDNSFITHFAESESESVSAESVRSEEDSRISDLDVC